MHLLTAVFLTACLAALTKGEERAPCINGATFNEETEKCDCPPGKIGDGQLCCVDEARDICVIRGDPILTSVANITRRLHYPCTHQVSKISNRYGEDGTCNMDVFTTSQFGGYGSLLPDAVGIKVSFGRISLFFTLKEISFYNPLTKMYEEMSPVKKARVFDLDGIEISLSFNFVERIWTFTFCGGEVVFRAAYNIPHQLIQPRIPGVCVSSKRASFKGLPMDGNVCNIYRDYKPAPFDYPSLRLLSDMITNFGFLDEQEKIDAKNYQGHCSSLTSSYNACRTVERKVQAIKMCAYIIASPIRRRCLSARRLDLFGVFTDCMAAFCDGDQAACDRLKNSDRDSVNLCYEQALECDSWV